MSAPSLSESNVYAPPSLRDGELAVLSWPRAEGSTNEDAAIAVERDDAVLLAVADGVGGMPGGERAARRALEVLAEGFLAFLRIEDAIERANDAVRDLRGPACTLVASTLADGVLRTFVVGDSQAMLLGGRGRIKAVTMAQSVVGHGTEAGLIDPQEAASHPQRNIVTNVLGEPAARFDRTRWGRIAPLDTLILASDGLFDSLPLETISELARERPISTMIERLARAARDSPDAAVDDLTVIAYRPKRAPRRAARPTPEVTPTEA